MKQFLNDITFANPNAFFLLVIPALFIVWYVFQYKKLYPELKLSSIKALATVQGSVRGSLKKIIFLFRVAAFSLLVIALARPQSRLKEQNITTEGIDIVMAVDISGSMLARDFQPDRLEAAKLVGADFIDGRPNDRIGLVVFAGESFTQSPLTTDHSIVKKLLSEIKDGMVEDGTAIGMGLATSVNRLKESDAKSKVVILLTDGVNNTGFIDPLTATDAAIQFGVRVYTIGVGTIGEAPYPFRMHNRTVYQNVEVKIDEELLQQIAATTGGRYFRATDNKSLQRIYEEIDELEKSKIQVASIQRVSEEFHPFLFLAGLFFLLELLLRYIFLKSIP